MILYIGGYNTDHMIILLPAIRIWINWFSKHTLLWYPVMSHDRVKSW